MSALRDTLLDAERRPAWCEAGDAPCEFPGCFCGPEVHCDAAIRDARSAAYLAPPYWPFAPRTPVQEGIEHPARHVRAPIFGGP